jgi:toxin ParE1/3/4
MLEVHKRAAAKRDLIHHYVYLAENGNIETAENFCCKLMPVFQIWRVIRKWGWLSR